ncbi:MAG TPA: indolepyruvate ferredoxin oxidoreductase subunit alpha, partial [Planctomycetes bacterium]|nr:indolepyruvate ferredoxin oxidoreductase subunit alpha [Planctomycetota bacterium]
MAKAFLSGNEALAQGVWEGGLHFATGYPGTPSTEILETIAARFPEVECQWAVNEKVAVEVAGGASFGGARAMATMKHVGLNVAADPFFSLSFAGASGGLLIVSADDPGMHSSQNEQDNRYYARAARCPMVEPSSSQEARDFAIQALEISEQFEAPILFRMTTRICHSKGIVET